MRRLTTLLLAAVAAVPLVMPSQAKADLRFCNHYPHPMFLAIGYRNDGCEERYAKTGWFSLSPSTCATVFRGCVGLFNRHWYYYAESGSVTLSGPFVTGVNHASFHKCWHDNIDVDRFVGFRKLPDIEPWVCDYTVNLGP
jgi:hypothetical protein